MINKGQDLWPPSNTTSVLQPQKKGKEEVYIHLSFVQVHVCVKYPSSSRWSFCSLKTKPRQTQMTCCPCLENTVGGGRRPHRLAGVPDPAGSSSRCPTREQRDGTGGPTWAAASARSNTSKYSPAELPKPGQNSSTIADTITIWMPGSLGIFCIN